MLPDQKRIDTRLAATFGILGRIVWNATPVLQIVASVGVGFQYPRTDRVECYLAWAWVKPENNGLHFQYPRTDRVECYRLPSGEATAALVLSVSSDGSCGMLPYHVDLTPIAKRFQYPQTDRVECYATATKRGAVCVGFQYPQTDRVECYQGLLFAPAPRQLLSVSSDGSCGMLHHGAQRAFPRRAAFSILRRIVWNATRSRRA